MMDQAYNMSADEIDLVADYLKTIDTTDPIAAQEEVED